ncbi:MAG: hypothetical protein DMG07_04975 [Acidobacteria bacterium]|nr:MAG: hypothetical protein DMG07_04975 [Acidobacteriota bacterium]
MRPEAPERDQRHDEDAAEVEIDSLPATLAEPPRHRVRGDSDEDAHGTGVVKEDERDGGDAVLEAGELDRVEQEAPVRGPLQPHERYQAGGRAREDVGKQPASIAQRQIGCHGER